MDMDITEQFLQFEMDLGLFSRTYCGEHYWHLIRFNLFEQIKAEKTHKKPFSNTIRATAKIKVLLRISFCAIAQLLNPKLRDADILLHYQDIYRNIDGLLTNVFLDPLMNQFCTQPVYIDPDFRAPFDRRYPNSSTGVMRFLLYRTLSAIFRTHVDKKEDLFLESLERKINEEFHVSVFSLAYTVRRISLYCQAFSIYVKKLLFKVKPKVVLTSCHYSTRIFVLIKEARKMGIPVIELQHGMFGSKHISYNFLDKVGGKLYFPDYILTYGQYSSDKMRLPFGAKAIKTGFVYMEMRMKKLQDIKRQDKLIVFYSSFEECLISVLIASISLARKYGYELICKLHPGEAAHWREYYPSLANADIEVIDAPIDIYELFLRGKHHVGVVSTTLYEAIGTGGFVHTHVSAESYMHDMLEAGAARQFSTADELMNNILEIDRSFDSPDNSRIAAQLFEPNALENQIDAIQNIVKGSANENSLHCI